MVIALGGNALMSPTGRQSINEEMNKLFEVSAKIARMSMKSGLQIAITHGNGTQVGDEMIKNMAPGSDIPALPLALMTAETQASIGSAIEISLNSKLKAGARGFATVVTHVVVEKSDRAFSNPTKPIGPAFTSGQIKESGMPKRYRYSKYGGKYRIVVPSPRPISILETPIIKTMLKSTNVICCGGGGIPVSVLRGTYSFEDAVIDKDRTSSLLARKIGASMLVILTDVDYVYRDFPKRNAPIRRIKPSEIMKDLSEFSEGSIRPKIEACAEFAASGVGTGIIGSLNNLDQIMRLRSGTIITE